MSQQSSSLLLMCSAASTWLVPILEPSSEAGVILNANTGDIVYQNHSARGILYQSSSSSSVHDWLFEGGTKSWADVSVELLLEESSTSSSAHPPSSGGVGGGCPVMHHQQQQQHRAGAPKGSTMTVLIPQRNSNKEGVEEEKDAKEISVRFQPIGSSSGNISYCSCGCGARYVVAYLKHNGGGGSNGGAEEEAHHRLQATLDASFDAMFTIDQKGTILMANQAAVTLFGYESVDDFFGQNVSMLCGAEHAHQHDEYLQHYLDTGIAKIMGKKRRIMAARKDKSEFPIELGIVELPSSSSSSSHQSSHHERFFSAFIRDLTLQEHQQAQVLEQVELTQGLVNASFDPIVQIDQRGIIQLANEATMNLFGYDRDEIIGSNISILCGGEHGAHHDEYLQRYLETGKTSIIGRKRQTTARRKDGAEFPIELGVQQVQRENGELVFCGFIRDLTSQTQLKESLQRQGKLIQNQFFVGATSSEDSSETGSTASAGGGRPRRPRQHRHSNTAPS